MRRSIRGGGRGQGRSTRRRIALLESLETRELLTLTLVDLSPLLVEDQPFSGKVATFSQGDVPGASSGYTATIQWKLNEPAKPALVVEQQTGSFAVYGSNTYDTPGQVPVTVTIGSTQANTASISATRASVVAAAPLTGGNGLAASGTAGKLLNQVALATFTTGDASTTGADYGATIDWGPGTQPTSGTITFDSAGHGRVSGSFTYALPGTYPVKVKVTRLSTGDNVTMTGSAVISAIASPTAGAGLTVVTTAGKALDATNTLATFSADPSTALNDYRATIAWGVGGAVGTGTVALANGQGSVTGAFTYPSPGTYPVAVTVTRIATGASVTMNGAVIVNPNNLSAILSPLTGGLDPLSDDGTPGDGVTRLNQPTLVGTAVPGATVRLFAQVGGDPSPRSLGQTIAAPDGRWQLTVGPLADGVYLLSGVMIPPGGSPTLPQALNPGARLVIDTNSPVLDAARLDRRTGQILLTIRDAAGGMDLAALGDATRYALVGAGGQTLRPTSATVVTPGANPVTVALKFNIPTNRLASQSWTLHLSGTALRDSAGNPLNGNPGTTLVPIGNSRGRGRRGR